jgi:hypothetical protein
MRGATLASRTADIAMTASVRVPGVMTPAAGETIIAVIGRDNSD